MSKSACKLQILFYRAMFKTKKDLIKFLVHLLLVEFFDRTFSFVILNKQTKFHYQAVFPFQAIR